MGKISLNGELVPEDEAKVSVFDRGFLYGDGVFETLRVREGQPRLLFQHLGRLQHGLDTLRVKPDLELDEFSTRVEKLIAANEVKNGVLRIQVTRGTGERGFAPIGEGKATVMLSTHPLPEPSPNKDGLRLMTSTQVVRAHDPLSTIKSCNKLPYILAAREAVRYQMDDALLMNREGEVTETTASNIFWVDEGIICTPPISVGCLAGVMRGHILELCEQLDLAAAEAVTTPKVLTQMRGVFLTNSVQGIRPVAWLDGETLGKSPIVDRIKEILENDE